jgi:serine/threonine protein kinase
MWHLPTQVDPPGPPDPPEAASRRAADHASHAPSNGLGVPSWHEAHSLSEAASETDPLIGSVIRGRYRLLYRLGTGGMSSVYLARSMASDQLVAVKLLRPDLAQKSSQRDRFEREARAIHRIEHDNVVSVFDYGETESGLVFLVMEYVPGEALYKLMTRGRVPVPLAVHIAQQVVAALAKVHEVGVVHRDLKPDNILLKPQAGRPVLVKVVDFGIAKIMDAQPLTGSQHIFGTPGYIAPEYIQSSNIDGRADFYSLGVILYEMITGCLPYDYRYPADLLAKHLTEQPVPPCDRGVQVPFLAEELILKCLEKDPSRRFAHAGELAEELQTLAYVVGAPAVRSPWSFPSSVPPSAHSARAVRPFRGTRLRAHTAYALQGWGAAMMSSGADSHADTSSDPRLTDHDVRDTIQDRRPSPRMRTTRGPRFDQVPTLALARRSLRDAAWYPSRLHSLRRL